MSTYGHMCECTYMCAMICIWRSEDLLEWFTGYSPMSPIMAVCLPVEGPRMHSCSVQEAGLQYMLEYRRSRL